MEDDTLRTREGQTSIGEVLKRGSNNVAFTSGPKITAGTAAACLGKLGKHL